ncbi:MAG: geranyl transferase [Thiotrichales bacterium]|nr:geranyl transferase [Thiotrichales bacterium]
MNSDSGSADHIIALRTRINRRLDDWMPGTHTAPERLHAAMRYAVLNGGKRIRAVLVYAAGQAVDAPDAYLDAPAGAVELIHAYSLVHDDMPIMDDDDLRRGKPSCHKAFDEVTALLAGDALQSLAFSVLAEHLEHNRPNAVAMLARLAHASGSLGMAGGQALDLAAVGESLDLAALENMHVHKTGALIRASVALGALSQGQVGDAELESLERYAHCIGLAFQIRDDVLDIESDTETLGKQQGADIANDKPTYPSLLGLEESKRRALDLHQEALDNISGFGAKGHLLRWLSEYIVTRIS